MPESVSDVEGTILFAFVGVFIVLVLIGMAYRGDFTLVNSFTEQKMRKLSCSQLREKYVDKLHLSPGRLAIVGCEGHQHIGVLQPGEGFIIRARGAMYINNKINRQLEYTTNGEMHREITFNKKGLARIDNLGSLPVQIAIGLKLSITDSDPSAQTSFIYKSNLVYMKILVRCKYRKNPPTICLLTDF